MRLSVSKNTCMFFTLMGVLLLLASCSGSGESGNSSGIRLSGLILPERVSVVDPQSSGGSGKPLALGKSLLSGITVTDLNSITPPTDYESDKATVYVNERSLDAFDTVNSILCTIRQTQYDKMVNQGPYKAQIDTNLCNSARSNASSAGQSSTDQSGGASMPQYETDTVNSIRATANSPQIIEVWGHPTQKPGDPYKQVIYGKAVITADADTAPPYGLFKINFKALDANDLSTVLFKGLLNAERDPATGKVLLYFSAEDSNSYSIQKATLDKDAVLGTGAGSVFTATSYPGMTPTATRFNLAYSQDYFLREDNLGADICLDRINYDESAWKYGLYTAQTPTGTRVNVNAGFPVKKNSVYGWVGYWGTWFPNGTTLNNNDVVAKHDYATNTDTNYTVLKSGGKLKKHTQKLTTLGGINSIPLYWWDAGNNAYQVAWNGSAFTMIAKQNPAPDYTWGTCGVTATCPPSIDLTALPSPGLAFWSQGLSGLVLAIFPTTGSPACSGFGPFNCSSAATNAAPVIFYSENIVYPNEFIVPTALACFDNCPDATKLTTNTPYKAINDYQPVAPNLATYASYTFDPTTMQLYDGGTSVVTTSTGTSYTGGVSSGPLFDPAILSGPTYTILGCDWNPTGSTCGGKAWSVLPYFYTWDTGPNEWNKFTGLIDASNKPVIFDPPLQIQYTHHETGSPYDNVTFFLQYNGFGDLQGIPGKCVNVDTGADADCSTASGNPSIRWVPAFTIPDVQPVGSPSVGQLTEVMNAGTGETYIVKALETEERMKNAPGMCGSLSTTAYTLPSMSSWIDPVIGVEPLITAPPAVIGGVLQ